MAKEHPEWKRVAVVSSDDATARATFEGMLPVYEELGFELIDTRWFPVGTPDFYPHVSPAMAEKPDILDLTGTYPEGVGGVIKAARELGFNGPIVTTGMMPKVLIDIAGIDNVEGTLMTSGWEHEELWENASQLERDHYARYMAKFNSEDYLVHVYYDDFYLTQQAIEKAGSLDPDKIVEALHTYEFQALAWKGKFYGEPRYGVPNQFPSPIWVSRITNGEVKAIGMAEPPVELYP